MLNGKILGASLIALSWLVAGCPGGSTTTDTGPKTDGGTTDGGGGGGDAGMETIHTRLGGDDGVKMVIGDFIGRVLGDVKINAYFLNSDLQATRLTNCLVKQVKAATGGGGTYPGTNDTDADGCRGMKKGHMGLNISTADFDTLRDHLLAAVQAKAPNATVADRDAIKGVLDGTRDDIVENVDTLYRRAGGKPGITKVIEEFEANVLADTTLMPFFTNLTGGTPTATKGVARLTTCLVRQVCEVASGPCKYDMANDFEATLKTGATGTLQQCRTMEMVHDRVMNPNVAGSTGRDITKADFDKLIMAFANSATFMTLSAADQMAVAGVLTGLCPKIVVAMPASCN